MHYRTVPLVSTNFYSYCITKLTAMTVRVVRGHVCCLSTVHSRIKQVSAPPQPRVLHKLDALVIAINVIINFHLIAGSVVTAV